MKQFSIYVPMNVETSDYWLQSWERELVTLFGGATTVRGHGLWLNSSQVVVRDDVAIVSAYEMRPGLVDRCLPGLCALAQEMKIELAQNAVLFTITDGLAMLV